jgi:RNA-directed DNA polymerase
VKKAKPFTIAKHLVWEAWQRVKANQGAPGIDDETIAAFEVNLKDNLYRLWNRMSSGSYFPPPVKVVEIPKKSGGQRRLGVPTVSDRLAQMVVKLTLEPVLEPRFHPDSYGYRPGKSALEAVGITRERCWRYDWLLEFDIRAAFDSISHSLLLKALKKHTACPWVLLYIERWLTVPFQHKDGRVEPRTAGLPQGGVLSPLLMNLFLHYTLDRWLQTHYPQHPFARYADDAVVHCKTKEEAQHLQTALAARLAACELTLHPEKTRVVYCRDANRTERHPQEHFEFLGYLFRPRTAQNRQGQLFLSFAPAMSPTALKKIRQELRFNWHLQRRVDKSLDDLARMFNPKIRGWYTYYGAYYRSALGRLTESLNKALVKWVMHKYTRFKGHKQRAREWLATVAHRSPGLFAHWEGGKAFAPAGR